MTMAQNRIPNCPETNQGSYHAQSPTKIPKSLKKPKPRNNVFLVSPTKKLKTFRTSTTAEPVFSYSYKHHSSTSTSPVDVRAQSI